MPDNKDLKKIFIIDDDAADFTPTIEILKQNGFEVIYRDNISDALKWLKSVDAEKLYAIVIDSIVPYGAPSSGYSFNREDTNGGKYTGVVLLRVIRDSREFNLKIRKDIPAIFHTNIRNDPQLERFADELSAQINLKLRDGVNGLVKKLQDIPNPEGED